MTNIHVIWVDKAQTILNTGCCSGDGSLSQAGPLKGGQTTICLLYDNRLDGGSLEVIVSSKVLSTILIWIMELMVVTDIKSLQVALEEQRGI